MSHYQAVIWIDRREARVFFFNGWQAERVLLRAGRRRQLHHEANRVGHGHAAGDHLFLQRVANVLSKAGTILVGGPANEKYALLNHLKKHAPAVADRVAAMVSLDHPTDGELLDHARSRFKADHQAPMRIRA